MCVFFFFWFFFHPNAFGCSRHTDLDFELFHFSDLEIGLMAGVTDRRKMSTPLGIRFMRLMTVCNMHVNLFSLL